MPSYSRLLSGRPPVSTYQPTPSSDLFLFLAPYLNLDLESVACPAASRHRLHRRHHLEIHQLSVQSLSTAAAPPWPTPPPSASLLSLSIFFTNNNLSRNHHRIASSSFACNSFPSTTSPDPISVPSAATHRFSPPHPPPAHCLYRSRSIVTASQRRLRFLSLLPSFAFFLRWPTTSDAIASFLSRRRQIPSTVNLSLSLVSLNFLSSLNCAAIHFSATATVHCRRLSSRPTVNPPPQSHVTSPPSNLSLSAGGLAHSFGPITLGHLNSNPFWPTWPFFHLNCPFQKLPQKLNERNFKLKSIDLIYL